MNRYVKMGFFTLLLAILGFSLVFAQSDPLKEKYDFALDDFNNAKNASDPGQKDQYTDSALQKFLEILDEDPNYSPARYHVGLIYYERNQFSKALEPLKQVANFDSTVSTKAVCNFYVGMCHIKLDQLVDALEPLQFAKELDPKSVYYVYQLADTYHKLNMVDKAIPLYEKVTGMENEDLATSSRFILRGNYWETGQYEKAFKACEQIAKINPDDKDNNIMLAQIYEKKKDWDSAISAWANVIMGGEADGQIYNRVASLLMTKKNNYNRAIEFFQQAEDKGAANALTYYSWGRALHKLKDLTGALLKFKKAVTLNANYVDAVTYQAKTELQLLDYDAALKTINQALNLKTSAFAYATRGEIRTKLYKNIEEPIEQIRELKCAIVDFKRAQKSANYKEFSTKYIDFCNQSIKLIVDREILVEDIDAIKCK